MEARKDQYEAYVKSVTPVHSTWKNVLMAGISGGLICLAAQISTNCLVQTGMEEKTAALWTMLGLILLSVILTGANVFQKLARVFGAGVLVPITGFANSVASPGAGIQGGRAGIWCRMQNIYNRGSGDPVWDSEFVGIRGCVLGVDDADSIINEKKSQ